jgi:ribosomal protein L11 methyltransferase
MSFGTGHHATTQLMMEEMLELDLNQSELLDMGCGTGILAILAEKRGASSIDAVDNDPQCIINSLENVELNNCKNIRVQLFSEFIPQKKYQCILANIQRNVLLDQMEMYANISQQGTYLLLSGIIPEDIEIIGNKAKEFNFNVLKEKTKGTWALLLLKKS